MPDDMSAGVANPVVRLRLITHNARMVDARKAKGLTQRDLAGLWGRAWWRVYHIETLKRVPDEDEMAELAVILEKEIDYLFPEQLLRSVERGVFMKRSTELSAPQLVYLADRCAAGLLGDGGQHAQDIEDQVDRDLLRDQVHKVLQQLTARERTVLELRFGLTGAHPQTYEEIGPHYGVTRERIRQIERKALLKLRQPGRSRQLKGYLE